MPNPKTQKNGCFFLTPPRNDYPGSIPGRFPGARPGIVFVAVPKPHTLAIKNAGFQGLCCFFLQSEIPRGMSWFDEFLARRSPGTERPRGLARRRSFPPPGFWPARFSSPRVSLWFFCPWGSPGQIPNPFPCSLFFLRAKTNNKPKTTDTAPGEEQQHPPPGLFAVVVPGVFQPKDWGFSAH